MSSLSASLARRKRGEGQEAAARIAFWEEAYSPGSVRSRPSAWSRYAEPLSERVVDGGQAFHQTRAIPVHSLLLFSTHLASFPSTRKRSALRERDAGEDDCHAQPLRKAYGLVQHEKRNG